MNIKKIAVATDDKKLISDHLGRAEYFAIYTISADSILDKKYIKNIFTPHKKVKGNDNSSRERARHEHNDLIAALSECELVLSRGIGKRMARDLQIAGINGYVVVEEGAMDEIIEKYIRGELLIDRDGGCDHDR